VRVVIADDEPLLRAGVRSLLEDSGIDVVATAGDAGQLLALVAAERPDVVITDIRMPPGRADDGLLAALKIRASNPGIGVIVLSQYVQRQYALELLGDDPSGVGYLLKQRVGDVERFCSDVRRVGDGGTVLDPEVVENMLARSHVADRAIDRMTERQREVLGLVAEGRSNAAIASALNISEKAVVAHVSHIYEELGLRVAESDHRRVLAVLRYLNR
jgi:DNA-binding NarL/FixJ family response regulator